MTYRVEAFGERHDVGAFDCGNDDLTDWLKSHAHGATGQGTRTYVLVTDAATRVVGYFAIAPHLVERVGVPKRVGRGAPRQIPAILLAKLAIDRSIQGTGLGTELLVQAMDLIIRAARSVGGKLVVVDAIDDAAGRFYERHDFERLPHDRLRLVMKVSTAAKALGKPWP